MPDATIAELHQSGLLRILAPRRYVGPELGWPTLVESARLAARTCPSTAWTIGLVGSHVATVARMSQECQEEVFGSTRELLVATASATLDGRMVRERGDVRVSGTWRFASAVDHAQWVVVTGHCQPARGGDATLTKVAIPRHRVEILDNWNASGMRATGSQDVRFDGVLVPASFAMAKDECLGWHPPGAGLHPDAYIYDVPMVPYSTTTIIGPLLGCAEGLVENYVDAARNNHRSFGETSSVVHDRLAESTAELKCARLLYEDLVGQLDAAGQARRTLEAFELLALRRDRAYLAHLCVGAAARLVRQLGASATDDDTSMQRHWRDLQVMSAHVDISRDRAFSGYSTEVLSGFENASFVLSPTSSSAAKPTGRD
jgi:3-hydroxy-9,10-secoandrosta-1,3,5(10)-triene-9,17-dione monooxygenase